MTCELPTSARICSRFGSSVVIRNTPQVSAEAQRAADKTPTLASCSCAPWKASEAISMARPSVTSYHGVLADSPAKADPLLLATETKASVTSVRPWKPGLSIDE